MIQQTPNQQTPSQQTPSQQTPKEQTPKEQTPKEQTPKEQTPKEQTPKEQTPKTSSANAPADQVPKTKARGARERLREVGIEGLSEEELVALLLGTGGRDEPVKALAARLLKEVGGAEGLAQNGVGALSQIRGIGVGKASRIVAAIELGRRVLSRPVDRGRPLSSSHDVAASLRPRFVGAEKEHLLAIALDAKNRPITEIEVASGGLAACPVSPADIFRALLREAAVATILVHNHPSGEPEPSLDDIDFTARLVTVGALLGIPVLDHIILGRERFFSFVDSGILEAKR